MLSLHFYVCYCVLISLFLGRGVVSQSCLITIIIHSFIPSFNKFYIKHQLCTRNYTRCWKYSYEHDRCGAHSLFGEMDK